MVPQLIKFSMGQRERERGWGGEGPWAFGGIQRVALAEGNLRGD